MKWQNPDKNYYPLTIEAVCSSCHQTFTATRTRRFARDGYPIYKKHCPDCIDRAMSTKYERYGTIAPAKSYDERLREGFRLLKSGGGNIEVDGYE